MILSCSKICKEYVANPVLKDVSFLINEKEKVAIVGNNGAGKSTLLKILIGEIKADSGDFFFAKGTSVGYLAQNQEVTYEMTLFDVMLDTKKDILTLSQKMRELEVKMKDSSENDLPHIYNEYAQVTHQFELQNGYAYRSEITGILKGLGFEEEDFSKKVFTLSGGGKTRLHLGKILLSKPDILFLDEPTNHLDINAVNWLENYLKSYEGTIVIVSHDRYFLDRIVNKVIEIEQSASTTFAGNYSSYAEKKKQLRENRFRQYLNQQKDIAHQEVVIEKLKSFNREKSIKQAESREKSLERMEKFEKPTDQQLAFKMKLVPYKESGKDVLNVKNLKKSFSSHLLFEQLHFEIKRGERVAIIGGNGSGKTTILKIINQILPADEGSIEFGTNVEVGYYDQEHQVLDSSKNLFDEISDSYPYLTNTEIRSLLARFLFSDEDVFKKISTLSGGEKARLSLAKLMLSEANFLILDEPTNHLDILSKEILEDALCSYSGTVLYVSHDRYFINKTATRILDLTEKQLLNYIGNYDYYLEKKEDLEAAYLEKKVNSPITFMGKESVVKEDWKKQKEEQARIRKLQNELNKIEDEIARLEEENEALENKISDSSIASEVGKLMELHKKKTQNDELLNVLMERWEELSSDNTPYS